ncbi:MAG: DUF4931 domain-containing protein [Candidatus Sungiibacteriota bacterium]|uniref:DUF4931 domain-containing protein n=1 Tax=Candidatus Sungiibacteriota bacterium TaxID=2750080 RepID=A0A7T5RJK8_9BACT|nr:MAG: DUF4931 domain-containing protein [Candidatus Sungbacteria bacterium]
MPEGRFSEFRREKSTNRWCIVAPIRHLRPGEVTDGSTERKEPEILEERIKKCPFCPGNEDKTPKPTILEYKKEGHWSLRIVPNKFPAVSIEAIPGGIPLQQQKFGVFRILPGFGAHEVIIDTPRHDEFFADFSLERTNDLFWAFRERILDLRRDKRFQYILIFRNEGWAAGASLEHSHCQLIGLPIVPPLIEKEFKDAESYYNDENSCVYCDTLRQEMEYRDRIFFANDYAVALTPLASRSPFEIWVLPKEHIPRYEESAPRYIRGLVEVVNQVAKRLAKITTPPPAYNFYLHNGLLRNGEVEFPQFHHHFEFVPRITRLGGFEWGTGLYINNIVPEEAAAFLRGVTVG